ncbi:MAG: L,D-transpeptidase family protein [Lachnospiraceae bacterium]|nr:L,D-transpeptidase family protein [Lachnospiraceae bacterium]
MSSRGEGRNNTGASKSNFPRKNIDVSKLQALRRLDEDKAALVQRQEENARIVEELRRRAREEREREYGINREYNRDYSRETPEIMVDNNVRQPDLIDGTREYPYGKAGLSEEEEAIKEARELKEIEALIIQESKKRYEAEKSFRLEDPVLETEDEKKKSARSTKDDYKESKFINLIRNEYREDEPEALEEKKEKASDIIPKEDKPEPPLSEGKGESKSEPSEKEEDRSSEDKNKEKEKKSEIADKEDKDKPEEELSHKEENAASKEPEEDEKKEEDMEDKTSPEEVNKEEAKEDKEEELKTSAFKVFFERLKKAFTDFDYFLLLRRIIVFSVFLAIIIYFIGAVLFSFRFYPNTLVNGIECGLKNAGETEQLVRDNIESYSLEVLGRNDNRGVVNSADIALIPRFNGEVRDRIKKQEAMKWPFEFSKLHDIELGEVIDYSRGSLSKVVDKMEFFDSKNILQPVDAFVGNVTDEGYVITPEDNGAIPVKEEILKACEEAIDKLEPELSIDNNTCYEGAEITTEDKELNELVNNLNRYCKAKITYKFGDKTEVLDGKQLSEWVTVEGTNVTFDESKIPEYVISLARRYDTFGQPHKFKTHSGEEITITEGAYGWWMDRKQESEKLLELIKSGYRGERTPIYKEVGTVYGENDYGDNYVEADLTSQHLWVYKDGKVAVESDFVSGNVSKGFGTHVGIYGITYKEEDATLSGASYSSKVAYWMPFNGNEGMHDASWRSAFGGEIYVTNGSHGCINLPVEKAKEIYNVVEEGEAVIVYGGKTYTPPASEQGIGELTPEQQLQLLIQAGLINPDGNIPEPVDNVENQE